MGSVKSKKPIGVNPMGDRNGFGECYKLSFFIIFNGGLNKLGVL